MYLFCLDYSFRRPTKFSKQQLRLSQKRPWRVAYLAMVSVIDNEVIDFADTLNRVATRPELIVAIRRVLNRVGFEYFSINFLPEPQQSFKDVVLLNHLPPGWLELYIREDFARADPSVRHCHYTTSPFEYQDSPFDPIREPAMLKVVQTAGDFSIRNGLVVPVAGLHGIVGGAWMGGGDAELDSRSNPLLHLLALYSFDQARHLAGVLGAKAVLTSRELEVLKWTASGNGAEEIGRILSISKRTVEWHLQIAMQKLGAKTKTHAVILAYRARLI
jgi:LuxR family transcriptional regulator, quorum-sensing system regulator BjaR1